MNEFVEAALTIVPMVAMATLIVYFVSGIIDVIRGKFRE